MPQSVRCAILDMPDGRFAVVAVLGGRKVFRRAGLGTLSEAEECVEALQVLMAACGAPVV